MREIRKSVQGLIARWRYRCQYAVLNLQPCEAKDLWLRPMLAIAASMRSWGLSLSKLNGVVGVFVCLEFSQARSDDGVRRVLPHINSLLLTQESWAFRKMRYCFPTLVQRGAGSAGKGKRLKLLLNVDSRAIAYALKGPLTIKKPLGGRARRRNWNPLDRAVVSEAIRSIDKKPQDSRLHARFGLFRQQTERSAVLAVQKLVKAGFGKEHKGLPLLEHWRKMRMLQARERKTGSTGVAKHQHRFRWANLPEQQKWLARKKPSQQTLRRSR